MYLLDLFSTRRYFQATFLKNHFGATDRRKIRNIVNDGKNSHQHVCMAVFHPFASRFGEKCDCCRANRSLSEPSLPQTLRRFVVSKRRRFQALRSEGESLLLYPRRSSQRALFFQSEWSQSSAPGSRWRLMGRIPSNVFVPSVQTALKMKNPSDSRRSFLQEEATADGRRDGGGGETLPTCSFPSGGECRRPREGCWVYGKRKGGRRDVEM